MSCHSIHKTYPTETRPAAENTKIPIHLATIRSRHNPLKTLRDNLSPHSPGNNGQIGSAMQNNSIVSQNFVNIHFKSASSVSPIFHRMTPTIKPTGKRNNANPQAVPKPRRPSNPSKPKAGELCSASSPSSKRSGRSSRKSSNCSTWNSAVSRFRKTRRLTPRGSPFFQLSDEKKPRCRRGFDGPGFPR